VKDGVVEVVLGVVVEEDVIGVNGKENLRVYVGCNKFKPYLTFHKH
jgi:hypothetical protein